MYDSLVRKYNILYLNIIQMEICTGDILIYESGSRIYYVCKHMVLGNPEFQPPHNICIHDHYQCTGTRQASNQEVSDHAKNSLSWLA